MLPLKVAYFNKVGKIENHGLVYRYIFASEDPHFYFAANIIPGENTYSIYGIPVTNNLDNNTSIKLGDNNNLSIEDISYGDEVSFIIGNDDIEGMSDFVEVSLHVSEKPVAVNGEADATASADRDEYLNMYIVPLLDVQLFKLSNIVRTEVTANIFVIQDLAKIDMERAIESFVFNILINKSVFMSSLPDGIFITKEEAYTLFSKILYGGAYTSSIPTVFADMINFFRVVADRNINITKIPTEILAILVSRWAKEKDEQYIDKLTQASNEFPIEMMVELNPVTISEQTKLFQVLNEIQSFVYVTKLDIFVDGEMIESFDCSPSYYELLYRTTDGCRVDRSIELQHGVNLIFAYGYGQGCDEFIGIMLEDVENSLYYGINKKDTLVNDRVEYAVVFQNGGESIAMLNGSLDSNLAMTFVLHGI